MMLNYLRYFIVIVLLGSLFYTYTITLSKETITNAIDRKLPMVIDKKGLVMTITDIEIVNIANNIVESKVNGTLKMSDSSKVGKFLKKDKVGNFLSKVFKKDINIKKYADKSMQLHILTKTTPMVHGSALSFKLRSLEINHLIKFKEIKGFLKKKIKNIKIPIKKLEKVSWFASVKHIDFSDNGDLNIDIGLSKWIIFLLIPLFLLREIGLFLIFLYQRLFSARKKYKCAKGELHQNGTCSSTTKDAFKKDGFIAGVKEYNKSTKACRQAYETIKEKENKKENAFSTLVCSGCSGIGGGTEAIGATSGMCDAGSCAAAPCDVAACG